MEIHFTWKTKLFSKRFEIFKNEILSGSLKKILWSRKVEGEMNGRQVIFETRGFFRVETLITNPGDGSEVGNISYNYWKGKAVITCLGKEYDWQFLNFMRSRWSLCTQNGTLISYQSRCFKGTITSYTDDEVLILTGFFIRNFFQERSSNTAATT